MSTVPSKCVVLLGKKKFEMRPENKHEYDYVMSVVKDFRMNVQKSPAFAALKTDDDKVDFAKRNEFYKNFLSRHLIVSKVLICQCMFSPEAFIRYLEKLSLHGASGGGGPSGMGSGLSSMSSSVSAVDPSSTSEPSSSGGDEKETHKKQKKDRKTEAEKAQAASDAKRDEWCRIQADYVKSTTRYHMLRKKMRIPDGFLQHEWQKQYDSLTGQTERQDELRKEIEKKDEARELKNKRERIAEVVEHLAKPGVKIDDPEKLRLLIHLRHLLMKQKKEAYLKELREKVPLFTGISSNKSSLSTVATSQPASTMVTSQQD